MRLSNKMIAELLGTFGLVLGGCGAALFGHLVYEGVALAFGLSVIAMAYAVGHISGAHLNPAVSFGFFVSGRMSLRDCVGYCAAQFVGASLAAAVIFFLCANIQDLSQGIFVANGYGADFAHAAGAGYYAIGVYGAFAVEMVLTFVFVLVCLGATDKCHGNGGFAGIAIGLCLTLVHLISIPLTNTSVNPARSFSQCLFSNDEHWSAWGDLWLFIVAPLAGAALAAVIYKAIAPKKKLD